MEHHRERLRAIVVLPNNDKVTTQAGSHMLIKRNITVIDNVKNQLDGNKPANFVLECYYRSRYFLLLDHLRYINILSHLFFTSLYFRTGILDKHVKSKKNISASKKQHRIRCADTLDLFCFKWFSAKWTF